MRALIDLALAVSDGEKVANNVSDVVRQALEQMKVERESAAAQDIVSVLKTMEVERTKSRKEIRRLKMEAKRLVDRLNQMDRAWAFAQETNNFVPVLRHLGLAQESDFEPEDFAKLSEIPADWTPEVKTEE